MKGVEQQEERTNDDCFFLLWFQQQDRFLFPVEFLRHCSSLSPQVLKEEEVVVALSFVKG